MSEIYALSIDQEWSQVSFDHEFLNVLRARNLNPEIEELYTVGTLRHGSEESSSYLLARVSHLEAPQEELDLVDTERKETYICGCAGWMNHCYDHQVGAKIDDCRHCERLKKRRGEIQDENQATLV